MKTEEEKIKIYSTCKKTQIQSELRHSVFYL